MAKLLHIQASPMGGYSFSTRVAQVFIDEYSKANPSDIVETLDVWAADLPEFDFTTASGKYKEMRGMPHSEDEARAWQRVVHTINHFKSADMLLVSPPMWNFNIPYRLKQYLDIVVQPGYTFDYDLQKGYWGRDE